MSVVTARDAIDSTTVVVRLFAGARAAAGGRAELPLAAPAGGTVTDLLDRLIEQYPATAAVLPACSFLLDGVRARPDSPIHPAATLDVLPPFSGG